MNVFTWAQQEYWPEDEPGKVFLGRAVHRVGKWRYGEGWIGTEPQAPAVKLPSLPEDATYSDQELACDLLAEFEVGKPEHMPATGRLPARYEFTDQQWSAAVLLSKQWGDDRKFRAAKREIRQLAKQGLLPTYWKDDLGDFQEIKQSLWSTDDRFAQWLSTCQRSIDDPAFAGAAHPAARCWIFADERSLNVLLAQPISASNRSPSNAIEKTTTIAASAGALSPRQSARFSPSRLNRVCEDLVAALIAAGGRRMAITDVVKKVKAELAPVPISREAIREAWRKARPNEWKKTGPSGPRKNSAES